MPKIINRSAFFCLDNPISALKRKKLENTEINGKFLDNKLIKSDNNQMPIRLLGETKHYNPANKQWPNSVYTYNKNYIKALPSKDNIANKIIKNYFFLSDCKKLARSRRMRALIRKSTAEKLYTSRPEIKQTSDKVIVTIYTFDRERQLLLKKIYFNLRKLEKIKTIKNRKPVVRLFNSYENWRNRYSLERTFFKLRAKTYLLCINTPTSRKLKKKYLGLSKRYMSLNKGEIQGGKGQFNKKISYFFKNRSYYLRNKLSLFLLKRKRKKMFQINTRKKRTKRHIPHLGFKSVNQLQFLLYKQQLKKKNMKIQKLLFYAYMKHILSKFGIKIHINKEVDKVKKLSNVNSGKVFFSIKGGSVIKTFDMRDNTPKLYTYLDKVNLLITSVLKKILENYDIPAARFYSFFTIFTKKNFRDFLSNEYQPGFLKDKISNKPRKLKIKLNKTQLAIVKREVTLISHYLNLKVNYLKFSNYLPALKLMISNIYNKSTELNIVNLKYPHLNADIFTQAIAISMRKKLGFLRIMRKSLELVKIPSGFTERTDRYNLNNIKSFNRHNLLRLTDLEKDNKFINTYGLSSPSDSLQFVLNKLYPRSLMNETNYLSNKLEAITINKKSRMENKFKRKIVNVLNSIKYKWVTGARLEAAGRLTRRYTAARSVYKHKLKGSLRDTDFSRKLQFIKRSMPVVISRNLVKSNSQYSFAKSKRRIGAFGIKGWINSH